MRLVIVNKKEKLSDNRYPCFNKLQIKLKECEKLNECFNLAKEGKNMESASCTYYFWNTWNAPKKSSENILRSDNSKSKEYTDYDR